MHNRCHCPSRNLCSNTALSLELFFMGLVIYSSGKELEEEKRAGLYRSQHSAWVILNLSDVTMLTPVVLGKCSCSSISNEGVGGHPGRQHGTARKERNSKALPLNLCHACACKPLQPASYCPLQQHRANSLCPAFSVLTSVLQTHSLSFSFCIISGLN